MNDASTFNRQALQRLRLERGLSQAQLARRAGITDAAICLLETGKRKRPHPSTLLALARALDVPLSDLWSAA